MPMVRSSESTASSGRSSTSRATLRVVPVVAHCCRRHRNEFRQLSHQPGTEVREARSLQQRGHRQGEPEVAFDAVLQLHRHQRIDPQLGERLLHIDLRRRASQHVGGLLDQERLDQRLPFSGGGRDELLAGETVVRALRPSRSRLVGDLFGEHREDGRRHQAEQAAPVDCNRHGLRRVELQHSLEQVHALRW